jgi:hypothetical protein
MQLDKCDSSLEMLIAKHIVKGARNPGRAYEVNDRENAHRADDNGRADNRENDFPRTRVTAQ